MAGLCAIILGLGYGMVAILTTNRHRPTTPAGPAATPVNRHRDG